MQNSNDRKVMLIIMDGWGKGKIPDADAIQKAFTPFVDSLYTKYPNSELTTFGPDVGLPEGQMGNSEVGHLNIGAGRIVYQELLRINNAIADDSLSDNPALLDAIEYAKTKKCKFHFGGLVSDGGIHSHINHLKYLLKVVESHGVEQVYIHAFTDGRDTDPKSGINYMRDLDAFCEGTSANIASVIGRYFAMDRDNRWERVSKAYDLLVRGKGSNGDRLFNQMEAQYQKGITDEFLEPILVDPKGTVGPDDVFLFFNFRTDRPRQLTRALFLSDIEDWNMKKLPLYFVTMTEYDKTYRGIQVLFSTSNIQNTLGRVLSDAGKKQIKITETEKYPHVTFFFNGGREEPFIHEDRILVDSPKVATYDLKPEMSAFITTDKLVAKLQAKEYDFACINYANTDMVGHTGVFEAAKKAAETVDQCVNKLVNCALINQYVVLIIADHGNSDFMINEDGSPNTAHTMNPVPCILVSKEFIGKQLRNGILADIAPTILSIMGIPAPGEMTGKVLI